MKAATLVTALSRHAGRAEPPPIDDVDVGRMIAIASRAEPARVQRSRAWMFALGGAVAAALAMFVVMPRSPASLATVARAPLVDLKLPTGDHLVSATGARFEIAELAPATRRIALHSGEVMFDVAHVTSDQRFEVVTDQLVATAKGTVFSVDADAVRSTVWVYEGVVEVAQAGELHTLIAGDVWSSTTATTTTALARPTALAPSIAAALHARAPVAAATPTPKPRMAPTPAIATKTVPITSAWSTDSVPIAQLPREQLLATARADLKTGKFAEALDTAKLVESWNGAWWQIVADAHRGAGDSAAAADAYDRAAKLVTGGDRSEAGYSAAYLRFRDLDQTDEALASIDAAGADETGSPLEERALGLRAQILVALGRDAKPTARRYLEQFPHADLRSYMLVIISK
jgi:hypothetical protein